MSLRPAQHWYLTCDTRDGDRRCRALYLPPARPYNVGDPLGAPMILAGSRDAIVGAEAAGWSWTWRQRERGWHWHCPEHGGAG